MAQSIAGYRAKSTRKKFQTDVTFTVIKSSKYACHADTFTTQRRLVDQKRWSSVLVASSKISSNTFSTSAVLRFDTGICGTAGIVRCRLSSHIPGIVRLLDRLTRPFFVESRDEKRLPLESFDSATPSFGLSKYLRILSSIFFTLSEDASYCFFILKDDGDFGFGGFGR